ncbi:MAG: tetratricopeptide repeat protein [Tahibacter sp.]
MTCNDPPERFRVGRWDADARTGELRDGDRVERLEPKTMELLRLFVTWPGHVLSREQILAQVWPDVIVADDALARAMFKLRRALGDDAKAANYVETLPKRGYRLIATVQALTPNHELAPRSSVRLAQEGVATRAVARNLDPESRRWSRRTATAAALVITGILFAWALIDRPQAPPLSAGQEGSALIERADDFYYRYSRADNEAAIELYERILAREPERVAALRGLANAFVQRVIRWPLLEDGKKDVFTTLTASLDNGHLKTPASQRILERAEQLARRAIALDPADSLSQRALGLSLSAQSRFAEAIEAYRAAIALDPDAWGALINLSETLAITGKPENSLAMLIAAHEAMSRHYGNDKQHIQPYYADLAVLIGNRLVDHGRSIDAEAWFKRALAHSPLHARATLALAGLLMTSGRSAEARQLCLELNARVGEQDGCSQFIRERKATTAPADSRPSAN